MRSLGSRLLGLLLLMIALGPLVVGIACFIATAIEVAGATKLVLQRAAPIVQVMQTQIVPVVIRIKAQTAELGDALTAARDQIDRSLAALKDVGTLHIDKGQLGQTPTLRVRLPAENVTFGALRQSAIVLVALHMPAGRASDTASDETVRLAFGPRFSPPSIPKPHMPDLPKVPDVLPKLKIDAGSILDKELPSFSIPPVPIALEVPALRQVFAPLGPDGPLGQAIQATTREMGNTFGEVGKLKGSLTGIADRLLGLFGLIPYTIPLMLATYVAIELAVASLLLMCLAATAYVMLRRPREAAMAFMLTPIGFVFYCLRAVLIEAVSRCSGRPAAQTSAEAVADLRRQVDELKAQVAARRAASAAGV